MEEFAKPFGAIVENNFPELEKPLAARIVNAKIATASNHAPEGVVDANSPTLNGIASPVSNAPNTPESNSSWKVFMVLLALVAGAATYFFLYHRCNAFGFLFHKLMFQLQIQNPRAPA